MNIKDTTPGITCIITEDPELRLQELGLVYGELVKLTTNNHLGAIIEHRGTEYFLRSGLEVEELGYFIPDPQFNHLI